MPQSLARILVHLVFSTKHREPFIAKEIRGDLHGYMVGTLQNLACPSIQTGGTADHVHVLFSLARTVTVADVLEKLKTSSCAWMKDHGVRTFAWQAGYGAFSIGESQIAAVIRYIQRQEEHHRPLTFQEEFRSFLDRYNVTYDERYVWD